MEPAPATIEDLERFACDGFLVVRRIVPLDIISETREFLSAAVDRTLADMFEKFGCSEPQGLVQVLDDLVASGRVADLDSETRNSLTGHLPLSTRLDPALRAIPQASTVRRLLEQVLATERPMLHLPPTARFVLPGNRHAGVPAHQDVSYNPHMSRFVTMWVPLVSIDSECGGVCVFEGSNSPVELLANHNRQLWLEGIPTDGFMQTHCTAEPGDVLLLNQWIVHGSVPNRSRRTRLSIDYRLFPDSETSTKHYLDLVSGTVHAPVVSHGTTQGQ